MCAYDAAKPTECTINEETSQECVFSAESWNYQGKKEGEAAGDGSDERADNHEDFEDAVCVFCCTAMGYVNLFAF